MSDDILSEVAPDLTRMLAASRDRLTRLIEEANAERQNIAVLERLLGVVPESGRVGAVEEKSQRDRLRNAIAAAGEKGVAYEDLYAALPDRPRQWVRLEVRRLVERKDGVRRDEEGRVFWTGKMTRQFARRTLP